MTASNEARKRRRYTAEDRARVLATVKEVGVVEAGRQHGVPQTTVSTWLGRGAAKIATEPAASAKPIGAPSAKSGTPAPRARTARRYTPSEKAEVLEHAAAQGVSAASGKFGASRFAIYEWQRKLAKAAKGEGPSPTSGPAPSEIEEQRDREILGEWRKHPGLGPSQIKNQLRRRGIKVSVATTRRVMEEQGYRPPKVKREPHDERFEAVRPNVL